MLDWLANAFNALLDFLYQLLLTLFDILKDLFIWIMEQLLVLSLALLDGLGSVLGGLDVASYWSAIPAETAYFMNLIGVSQALGMIITALGIRFLLQLIPFVRWGS